MGVLRIYNLIRIPRFRHFPPLEIFCLKLLRPFFRPGTYFTILSQIPVIGDWK
jgi:hypothetical protein